MGNALPIHLDRPTPVSRQHSGKREFPGLHPDYSVRRLRIMFLLVRILAAAAFCKVVALRYNPGLGHFPKAAGH